MKTQVRKQDGLLLGEYRDALEREYEQSIERNEVSTKLPNLSSQLTYRRFERRKLSCVDFGDNDLTGSVFIDCDLRGSIFDNAVMDDVTLIRCHIYRCSLPENQSLTLKNCCRDIY